MNCIYFLLIQTFLFFVPVVLANSSNSICFDELGCFDNNYPWYQILRPFPMPESPKNVNTTFFFSNRVVNKKHMPTWPIIEMNEQFNAQKPTYFITHGYSSDTNSKWFKNLTEAILLKRDANVFSVDWKKGSSSFYFSASSNTRIVAAEISRVIRYLVANSLANLASFHLMGHSLGAHIMSYVGKNISGINRITAMDPAQPGFQGKNALVRLDEKDAKFIDVIHTDGSPFLPFLGLGITKSVGTVDFFVNGGLFQPNCIKDGENFIYKSFQDVPNITLAILYNLATCSHSRAPRYMAAAIKENCNMWGYRYEAESTSLKYKNFIINNTCEIESCNKVGLDTDRFPAIGNFAMMTSGTYPFCLSNNEADGKMARVSEKDV